MVKTPMVRVLGLVVSGIITAPIMSPHLLLLRVRPMFFRRQIWKNELRRKLLLVLYYKSIPCSSRSVDGYVCYTEQRIYGSLTLRQRLRLSWREVLIRSLSTMRRQWLEGHLAYRPKAHRFSSIMGNTTFSILHGRRMICVPNLYTVPTRLPVRMKGVYFSRIVVLRREVLST